MNYLISDTKLANNKVLNHFWDLILFAICKLQNFPLTIKNKSVWFLQWRTTAVHKKIAFSIQRHKVN